MIRKHLLIGFLTIGLSSCASVSQVPDGSPSAESKDLYEARVSILTDVEQWSMGGKLAISDGQDGGSGNLEWRRQSELSELDFRGAFGRGAWQLDIRPGQSVLNFASGESWEAAEVTTLVRNHVGWEIPVDALEWWIRGIAAPDGKAVFALDESGKLGRLEQYDWTVIYQRYRDFSGIEMPTRIEATNGERKVKFVVRQWKFPERAVHES
ncbi:MAG TPA: lipoprotein insertase outer membrane protein LolB [Xanthomonadales bacterium]|nr:lipoprotein insertase outer membrane protein LolB [Xanthomonadales bacterium]